jgi:tetratricopeptide (TPR) repeat protein
MPGRGGEPGVRSDPWGRQATLAAGILLLGLFAYSNSLQGAFVYDDFHTIRDNPSIRSLGAVFADGGWRFVRVLGLLSFALNFRLGGLSVVGYHATNVAIHLASALLVYALVALTFRSPRVAGSRLVPLRRAIGFVAAALFVTHPVQTQAVAYLTQRYTSLATFFCLASLVPYAAWRLGRESDRPGGARQGALLSLAILADVAAMFTKEISFALPFGILLYEALFFRGPWRRRAWYLAPFALTLPIVPLNHLLRPLGPPSPDQPAPLGQADYLITQVAVVGDYLRLLVLPVGQALDHAFPVYRSLLSPRVLLSAAIIALLSAAAVLPLLADRGRRSWSPDPAARLVSFGIAWFFLGLAPQSTLVPNPDVLMEHRVYLPSIGAAVAVATVLGLIATRARGAHPARVVLLTGLGLSLVLATATMTRNEVWRSELSLWRDSASKSPSTSRSHANLGTLLMRAGETEAGLAELRQAVALAPDWAWPRAQLGAALLQAGRLSESEAELRRSLAGNPDDLEACFNLGALLARTGRQEEARPLLRRFLDLAPASYAGARRTAESMLRR